MGDCPVAKKVRSVTPLSQGRQKWEQGGSRHEMSHLPRQRRTQRQFDAPMLVCKQTKFIYILADDARGGIF